MFSKQSHLVRSSSLGGSVDSLVWSTERKHHSNASKLIQTPRVIKNSDAAVVEKVPGVVARLVKVEKKPRESIFTLNSPPRESVKNSIEERSTKFLDICALCKKRIPWKKDRYMYGYLQAFCSTECRDDKILLDGEFSLPSQDCGQTRNNLIRNLFNIEALFRKLCKK